MKLSLSFLIIVTINFMTVTVSAQITEPKTRRDTLIISNRNLVSVKLEEIAYNKKAISSFGFGKATFSPTQGIDNTVYALTYSTNRWWVNKYIAGGWFYDLGFTPEGGYSLGPQLTAFAQISPYFLPYATFAMGFGYDVTNTSTYNKGVNRFYAPRILKIGGFIFFKKNKGFGIFSEVNMYFNDKSWPIYRVGIAWSKLKRP